MECGQRPLPPATFPRRRMVNMRSVLPHKKLSWLPWLRLQGNAIQNQAFAGQHGKVSVGRYNLQEPERLL